MISNQRLYPFWDATLYPFLDTIDLCIHIVGCIRFGIQEEYIFILYGVSVFGYNTISVLGYKRNTFSNRSLYPFLDTIDLCIHIVGCIRFGIQEEYIFILNAVSVFG